MSGKVIKRSIKLGQGSLDKSAEADFGYETHIVRIDITTDYNGNIQLSPLISGKEYLGAVVRIDSMDGVSGGTLSQFYIGPPFLSGNGYYISAGIASTGTPLRNKKVTGMGIIFIR